MITIPDIMAPVIRDVRTKDERDVLRDEVEELEMSLFRSDSYALEKTLKARLPKEISIVLKEILARPEFTDNPEALKTFFRKMKDILDTLSLLKLNIAFQPSEEMITRLHEWILINLPLGVVLDIGYDGSIIGGARIIFGGKYKEMTLAQMIMDVLAKEKTIIMEMIRK